MANIYDSEIKCADKKVLKKITKLILKHTPSQVYKKKSDNVIVFETRWGDLDKAMEIFSKDFPEVTFSCSFIHITSGYDYYYTLKDYQNGVVTYKGLQPMFMFRSAGKIDINLKDSEDFISHCTSFFRTMYEEQILEDGTYFLKFIPDRYRSKNEKFYLQAKAEYEEYILTATHQYYSVIEIDVTYKDQNNGIESKESDS